MRGLSGLLKENGHHRFGAENMSAPPRGMHAMKLLFKVHGGKFKPDITDEDMEKLKEGKVETAGPWIILDKEFYVRKLAAAERHDQRPRFASFRTSVRRLIGRRGRDIIRRF